MLKLRSKKTQGIHGWCEAMAKQPEIYEQVKVDKSLTVTHVLYGEGEEAVWHAAGGATYTPPPMEAPEQMMPSAMGQRKKAKAKPRAKPKTVITSPLAPDSSALDALGIGNGNDS